MRLSSRAITEVMKYMAQLGLGWETSVQVLMLARGHMRGPSNQSLPSGQGVEDVKLVHANESASRISLNFVTNLTPSHSSFVDG